jgi:hypothetical protein
MAYSRAVRNVPQEVQYVNTKTVTARATEPETTFKVEQLAEQLAKG